MGGKNIQYTIHPWELGAVGFYYCDVRGQEREIVSNARGEYWIILLPGLYHITAQHTNSFGSLMVSTTVEVKNFLGEGAKILHLLLKPR